LALRSPSLELLKYPRLNFKTLRFPPAAPLERRERFVDRAEWSVRLEGVDNARLHRRRNLVLVHDVIEIPSLQKSKHLTKLSFGRSCPECNPPSRTGFDI
jgi:hypothetical protein